MLIDSNNFELVRSYKKLVKHGNVYKIRKCLLELYDTRISKGEFVGSESFYGASFPNAELLTRQYIIQLTNKNYWLRKKLILGFGGLRTKPIVFPLPDTWLEVLQLNGLKVDWSRSRLLWKFNLLLRWLSGVVTVLKLLVVCFYFSVRSGRFPKSAYAYFQGLTIESLPSAIPSRLKDNVCDWYIEWGDRPIGLSHLYHNLDGVSRMKISSITVDYTSQPYYCRAGLLGALKLFYWALSEGFFSAIEVVRGRYWYALLYAEASRSRSMSLNAPCEFGLDYLFYFSGSPYRPMWTYVPQSYGSRIICYHYSLSAEPLARFETVSKRYELGPQSWPYQLVWNDTQKELISKEIDPLANIITVGPIPFSGSMNRLPDIPARSAAVFDIQPHRLASYQPIGTNSDYYDYPAVNLIFFQHLYEELSKRNILMVLKPKRSIAGRLDKKYKHFLDNLTNDRRNVMLVDSKVSALSLVSAVNIVVSFPFTSTAHFRSRADNSNVYYDPTGLLPANDPASHGVAVVSGRSGLTSWLSFIA